ARVSSPRARSRRALRSPRASESRRECSAAATARPTPRAPRAQCESAAAAAHAGPARDKAPQRRRRATPSAPSRQGRSSLLLPALEQRSKVLELVVAQLLVLQQLREQRLQVVAEQPAHEGPDHRLADALLLHGRRVVDRAPAARDTLDRTLLLEPVDDRLDRRVRDAALAADPLVQLRRRKPAVAPEVRHHVELEFRKTHHLYACRPDIDKCSAAAGIVNANADRHRRVRRGAQGRELSLAPSPAGGPSPCGSIAMLRNCSESPGRSAFPDG